MATFVTNKLANYAKSIMGLFDAVISYNNSKFVNTTSLTELF